MTFNPKPIRPVVRGTYGTDTKSPLLVSDSETDEIQVLEPSQRGRRAVLGEN